MTLGTWRFLAGRATALSGLLAVGLLAGCANMADEGRAEANDPLEIPNRFVFALNETVDTFVLRPVAVTYRDWMPEPGKDMVRNLVDYLTSPVILANDVFQGEWERAGVTSKRFFLNSFSAGLYDIAALEGYEKHSEDFGQTLAVYGVPEGPYLVLPLIGPSNPRDAVGLAVDMVLDPLNWYAWNTDREWIGYSRAAANAVDARARSIEALDDVKANNFDYYAAIRSLYRQRRDVEIRNNRGTDGGSATSPFRDYVPGGKDAATK
ncbi:MlaA family lipoprotein [Oceanibaculum indicum]|uniref:VacJ family lipoprotein n=2 Tax=Oceanibaculum indicum TaxID=526216 RepID=K2JS62_9PROT|nr:VacJ family lipoprotein [Oceanibaculum indicum]EKE77352.1 VacJ family lipoprotein [Oceanibaculum indicum P24]RKQ68121.1 phospholipid-binding lipoprotein MlaA [Oceanibaculum indicum]